MKQCIITLATRDLRYPEGLDRLRESVKRARFKGDFLYWLNSYPVGCPPYSHSGCVFKPFCFKEAKERGYELVLWMDVSGIVVRSLTKLFKKIEREGYLIFKDGVRVIGECCADAALESFGISQEEAFRIPRILSGFLGLNMKNEIAVKFLSRWLEKAIDGITFRGTRDKNVSINDIRHNKNNIISMDNRVRGHLSDQSVAAIIANQLKMKLTSRGLAVHNDYYVMRSAIIVFNYDVKRDQKLYSLNKIYFIKYLSYLYLPFFLLRKLWRYLSCSRYNKKERRLYV